MLVGLSEKALIKTINIYSAYKSLFIQQYSKNISNLTPWQPRACIYSNLPSFFWYRMDVQCSICPIFTPSRARALKADWPAGPGVLVLVDPKSLHLLINILCGQHHSLGGDQSSKKTKNVRDPNLGMKMSDFHFYVNISEIMLILLMINVLSTYSFNYGQLPSNYVSFSTPKKTSIFM